MGRPPKGQSVHSEELLKCAQTLLENGHLVDTTVMTQGKTFKAHGLVLAAYSCYFKAVMTSEEGTSNVFVLDNLELTSTAFKVILDYMYNGVLNVVEEDLKHVEHAATQLQVESAVKLIEKMKNSLQRIKQRQLRLEDKIERKRLKTLHKNGASSKKKEQLEEHQTSVTKDLLLDEDTEDAQIGPTIPEEEQLDVIAQAWKAVARTTYDECEDDATFEWATKNNDDTLLLDVEVNKENVNSKEDVENEERSSETNDGDKYTQESSKDNLEDKKDFVAEISTCTIDNSSSAKELLSDSKDDEKTITEVITSKENQIDCKKMPKDICDEVTANEHLQEGSTSQTEQLPDGSTSLVRREVQMEFGTLKLTLGSNIDFSKLLESDDSLMSTTESENENETKNVRDDPDFNVSVDEYADDPDYEVNKKVVKKGFKRSLRKPSRPIKIRKMRKRKGRPRKVVVEDNDLETENDLEIEEAEDVYVNINDKVSIKKEVEMNSEPPRKGRRGRPKGSRNKLKMESSGPKPVVLTVPKRRGRPPGSGKKEPKEPKPKKSTSDKPRRPKTKLLPEENLWTMYDKEVNMFQCPECPYRTRTDKVFRLHRRRHTGYKPYPCQYCGKAFIDRKYLVPHERSHTGERPYKCDYCPSAFYDKKHLNRHVKRHTGQRDCLCSECGLAFYDNDTLKRHHTAVHLNIRPHKCDAEGCKYAAKDPSALREHKQQHSREAEGILCDLCGKTFINMNGLRIHKISHEDARFQCNHCPFIAHYKHVLRNHCVRLHGVDLQGTPAIKNVKCEICDFTCFTKQERHLHMLKKHLNERPHKCPICDFSTVDKGSLKKHLRTHTGVAPFECVCGKRFVQHSGYVRHYRSHTGEKPYRCRICDKTYADKKSLNTHLYGHANAKPYACQICGMFSAVRQEHLKKHIVKQHGEEVFEEYKRKGLCKPTLNAHEAASLSANADCIESQTNRPEEMMQTTLIEEIKASPAPSHDSQPTDGSQVLMVTPTTQHIPGQPQQQVLMAPQLRVYEEPNMAAVSHPMVVFPGVSQGIVGGFPTHHVMEQHQTQHHIPPQAHMGHLTPVNMAELTALTPIMPQQQPHTPTNLVMQQLPSTHPHLQSTEQPMQLSSGQPPQHQVTIATEAQYYSTL